MTPGEDPGRPKDDPSADDDALLPLFRRTGTDPNARDELVARYLPLAEYLARRFSGRGEQLDDLVQVASMGLLHAIDRFDPDRGVRFTTYASATIVGELKRHFRDKGWAVRIPRRMQELSLEMNRVMPQMAQTLGRMPTIAELAAQLEVGAEEIVEAMDASQAYSTSSLDAPVGEGDLTAGDLLGEDDPSLAMLDEWADLAPVLASLPRRERRVLYLRFYEGKTQSEIAADIGVSQMHVSRILTQTLEKLRTATDDPS
jgi:RNA polymerase sigma-B factor